MATNDNNFEEVAPKKKKKAAPAPAGPLMPAAYSSTEITERADQAQAAANLHPDFMAIDHSPQGQANSRRIAQEAAADDAASAEFESHRGPIGEIPAANDPYIPGGAKPPTARAAEFNEEGRAKSEAEKMRPGMDATLTESLDEYNRLAERRHKSGRAGRLTKAAMATILPVFQAHEDFHNAGNHCTAPNCLNTRANMEEAALENPKSAKYTIGHFIALHPEAGQTLAKIKAQAMTEPRNADYEPITPEEAKNKPGIMHNLRLHALGRWTGLGADRVRAAFSSSKPAQLERAERNLAADVALETAMPGMIPGKRIPGQTGPSGPMFTKPVAPKDWLVAVDSDTVQDNVRGTFAIMRRAHSQAKGREYDVYNRLRSTKKSNAEIMSGIHDRDAKEAALRIAARELMSENGIVGQSEDLEAAKYTGFEQAKKIVERTQAVRDAQESRRRGGSPTFRDVPAAVEDPRVETGKASNRQAASITRHLPHVLQDMADAHNNGVTERRFQLGGRDVEGPLLPSIDEAARKRELGGYDVQGPLQTAVSVNVNPTEVAKRVSSTMVGNAKATVLSSGVPGSMSSREARTTEPRREVDDEAPTTRTPQSKLAETKDDARVERNQRIQQLGSAQFEGPLKPY